MDDYIRRSGAYTEIMGQPPDAHYPDWYGAIIQSLPAADVRENVKARWIDMGDHLLCSGCGATHYGADKNFCPNCGADMRGEQE